MSENSVPQNSDFSYLQSLSRGGLNIPSINLVNSVCTAFTILNYSVDVIPQFDLPLRTAAERILCHFSSDYFDQYICSIQSQLEDVFVTVQ